MPAKTKTEIVNASFDAQYVALSYTWGDSYKQYEQFDSGTLLSVLPPTIEDAITATRSLGMRYLWIDAYCIIQSNEGDFKRQIRQMDLIYRCAQITIIAAAGTGANSGLSGLSMVGCRRQSSGTYDGISLCTFSRVPWDSIQSSAWSQRGWTFQESFFSRRRLYLNKQQAMLDCYQGTWVENLTSFQTEERKDLTWFTLASNTQIFSLIEEFTHCQLTFSNDILNAFEGIRRAFGERKGPISCHWGVPCLADVSGAVKLSSFFQGLCWSHTSSYRALVPPRRKGFPSWSWAGWYMQVWYNFPFDPDAEVQVLPET